MTKKKNLSNPFSTGGGGGHFEAHVQASFVALMLTGGHAPCLPCWPITEIKLQGKIDGADTDDLIITVENPVNKEQRKLFGQIKHSISITQGSTLFGEVIQAAWNDFNNSKVFTKDKDIIALITGPLNVTDAHNVQWLLNQARHTKNVDEFYRHVQQANFSPPKSNEKLDVIRHHLKTANGDHEVLQDDLYEFLNHFHLLGYDLGNEFGVVLSLLHSHISQFQKQKPQQLWASVVETVQSWNQDAGTITSRKLPEDLRDSFKQNIVREIPEELKPTQEKATTDWSQHPDAIYLILATLIGAWNEKSSYDIKAITQFFSINYDEWLKKAREILHCPDSPLSLKNGVWRVVNRTEIWNLLGSRILDQNLDAFKSLAITLLKESAPAFELSPEERYAVSIHGKVSESSQLLRKGVAEGLAILGSRPDACRSCSQRKAETTCLLAVREILSAAGWVLWGSLNDLLPTLAEAAPNEFLNAVEEALRLTPCPFDELFAQEGNGITGGNYITGLLWALEGLAWYEQYLVRVCVVLGELASHDPGGNWANRPSNSLATILLPWLPQTLASADKRKVAVRTLFNEWPDIAWNLIIQLLPGQHQTSAGSHKPTWRQTISADWEKTVTNQEYWDQVLCYADIAVTAAASDTARLSVLVDHFGCLPKPAFDQLVEVLTSMHISALPEEQRLSLWDHLTRFTNKHRRFSDAEWALPDMTITRIEQVAEQLAPTNPFNLYQHLFTNNDFDLYEENGDWEEQRKKLAIRRDKAVSEIYQKHGCDGVIRFAEFVDSPSQAGYALGVVSDDVIEQTLLPHFLDASDNKHKELASNFVWRCYHIKGWEWCDSIDKSSWTLKQIGQFLACLPFTKNAWDRANEWLRERENEYWTRTNANVYQADGDLAIAIEKLIEHGRPSSAINCLEKLRYDKQPIDTHQCVKALLAAAVSSSESGYVRDRYYTVELIKFLQSETSVARDELFKVEWAYLPLLDHHRGAAPKLLESKLASDPEFYCQVIRWIYRSKKVDQPVEGYTEASKIIATNAWQLLHEWKTPPGIQEDGTFSDECFTEWLRCVKALCTESGHLEVALNSIGEVLIYVPADLNGLWINRTVAAALNDRQADAMRNGFSIGTYNSRGVHRVDPTGYLEKELAKKFRGKAEEIENAGFQRFAVTLRGLADGYDQDAEQVINDNKDRDND
jgi:hypothetical protein